MGQEDRTNRRLVRIYYLSTDLVMMINSRYYLKARESPPPWLCMNHLSLFTVNLEDLVFSNVGRAQKKILSQIYEAAIAIGQYLSRL